MADTWNLMILASYNASFHTVQGMRGNVSLTCNDDKESHRKASQMRPCYKWLSVVVCIWRESPQDEVYKMCKNICELQLSFVPWTANGFSYQTVRNQSCKSTRCLSRFFSQWWKSDHRTLLYFFTFTRREKVGHACEAHLSATFILLKYLFFSTEVFWMQPRLLYLHLLFWD